MAETSPWADIALPSIDFNVRQVLGETAVPCFWGRDTTGSCLFIIELDGDHIEQFRKNLVTVQGIDVDLRAGDRGSQRLVLSLDKQVDRDLFEGLCRTLSLALENASDSSSALAIALAHIRRWKSFLSGRSHHLSAEEVRGLFCELTFLLELIEYSGSPTEAVEAWLGPQKSHQDFIFGNKAVEIKSLSGTERSNIRISSEDQLESLNDALFLRIYRLSSISDAHGSQSLNEIITKVQFRLDEDVAVDDFHRKLALQGYAPLPEYDMPRFVVSDLNSYRVVEGFPRIIRSLLPSGIDRVSYDIRLEAIAEYECNNTELMDAN